MEDLPPSPSDPPSKTKITDLNEDSLAHCASYLNLQEVINVAITCKTLKRAAYSDSVWKRFFREKWTEELLTSSFQASTVRDAYLTRHTAINQFKFEDPLIADNYSSAKPFDHILFDEKHIFYSQGSGIQRLNIKRFSRRTISVREMNDHKARITSMRLFPINETFLFRSEAQNSENILVSSSNDWTIRLWWKNFCQKSFKGHNAPVTSLSDKLLGDGNDKLLASGGEDGTVRLWSLRSSGSGKQALRATLYGHQRPIKLVSVAGHKTSLLVTMSRDSMVRVWDASTSSTSRSSCCVGMSSVAGSPIDMKCHESLLYVAAGSSVVAIDLRTMQRVTTAAVHLPNLCSFAIAPSKSLICTGGVGKAILWDPRKNQDVLKPEPVAELEGHIGSLSLLHMDPYKVVAGGSESSSISIWETDTGRQMKSFNCYHPLADVSSLGCSAMAVNGCRIVMGTWGRDSAHLQFRDFSKATCPVQEHEDANESKFWGVQSYSDDDEYYSEDEGLERFQLSSRNV